MSKTHLCSLKLLLPKKLKKKMVTITASYTVTPNKSTPQGRLWLSDLDQLFHFHRTPLILVYKATNNNTLSIERLKNSLSEILFHYYPMAGRLCITENGRIEVDLNAKGAVLFEAETTKTMNDFGDFSPSDSITQLTPTIDNDKSVEDNPIFAAQITRFSCNKGFVIGTSYFHVLSDGVGFSSFINSWAKIARGETLDENQKPFLDRTILNFSFSHPQLLIPPCFDHFELNPPPLILGRSDDLVERNKKTTAELLRLSAEQVEILKKRANEIDSRSKRSRGYSRYESIAAHIWKCASKARDLEEKQETLVGFNVEIRNRMIPPLPKNYFGNCLISTAGKGYIGEITSKPLGYVAEKIRKASELVSDEYIKSQINVIIRTRSKECLDGGDKNPPFYGNPNLRFTSWINMPLYDADFGCGKPVYFGLGYVCPYDRAVILDSSDGDGSIIVCMHFQIAHMQLFKKFFYEDIYQMFTSSRL